MLKTVAQIAQMYGKVESVISVAVARLSLKPDYTKPHAGKIARYYDADAQKAIHDYIQLSRKEKLARLPPRPKKKPAPRTIPRRAWTLRTIARNVGCSFRGVKTLLALHGYPTLESFLETAFTFEDVKSWYDAIPGETAYLKGRSLFKLGIKNRYYSLATSEKIHAAQSKVIQKYDPETWATRKQASAYLGYNDTSTYALYKGAGLRFIKDRAVLLYNWEDLRVLKAHLLSKKRNESNLAEVVRTRLLAEGFDFTIEKTFSNLAVKRPLRFDFCIASSRILIEVQGNQHFVEGFVGIQKETLSEIQRRDMLKRAYANDNGWDLIWVSALHDIPQAIEYIKSIAHNVVPWDPDLVRDYGECALEHYDGDARRFCWLHRGHFPYDRAGMILKRIHRSYWHSTVKGHFSPYITWSCKKATFQALVVNRQKYHPALAGKPGALPTLSMLVAGFGISKISPPVSFFSPAFGASLIREFVTTGLIVDPFSGFSGRAMAAHLAHKSYLGFDISNERVQESQEVISAYKMQNIKVMVQDVLSTPFIEYENATILTCPPYGDAEAWPGGATSRDEDYWIDQVLRRYGCSRYIFVVGYTVAFQQFAVPVKKGYAHPFYEKGSRIVLTIERRDRDSLVSFPYNNGTDISILNETPHDIAKT